MKIMRLNKGHTYVSPLSWLVKGDVAPKIKKARDNELMWVRIQERRGRRIQNETKCRDQNICIKHRNPSILL